MITKEEIQKIIYNRENKITEWIEKNPEKLSLLKLKTAYKNWLMEVGEARKISKENDPKLPNEDFGFVYSLMNEFSAYRACLTVAMIYIIKLEKKLDTYQYLKGKIRGYKH